MDVVVLATQRSPQAGSFDGNTIGTVSSRRGLQRRPRRAPSRRPITHLCTNQRAGRAPDQQCLRGKRNVAGQRRGQHQRTADRSVGRRVEGPHSKQQRIHQPDERDRASNTAGDAHDREREAFAQNIRLTAAWCAPNAMRIPSPACAERDSIRDDPADADNA